MAPRPLAELVDASWLPALEPQADASPRSATFLRAEIAAGRGYLPAGENVLRAFRTPLDAVRVLIVGQDPYPTPGHPVGLSFSVAPDVRPLPKSLANIFTEYVDDLGLPYPGTGDLSPWAAHGVMLLNRVLTVQPGAPASHRGKGWEQVTEAAIEALATTRRPPGGGALGARRPGPRPDAGRRPAGRQRPPEPAVGVPRLLRLAAVQPGQRRATVAGWGARGLAAALTAACSDAQPCRPLS